MFDMADEITKYEDLPDKAVDAGDVKEYEKPEPPPNPSVIMLPGQTTNKTYLRKTVNIKAPKEPRVPKIISALPSILPKERKTNELDDLFEVPQDEDNDINTDDLFKLDNQDFNLDKNIDDLVETPQEILEGPKPEDEDVYIEDLVEMPTDLLMNGKPKRKPIQKKFSRTAKPFNYPVVGGIQ
jgi:hypothetical protein